MILILFSWLVMLVFFIPTGILLMKISKIKTNNFAILALLGMFLQCFLLSFCCFFVNIGIEIFLTNIVLNTVLYFKFKKDISNAFSKFIFEFKKLELFSKILMLTILLLTLYKCSLKPFLVDNESYYIQTIKWINEYGFVKGLANLHIFLAQMSPLHVLQAGFNFSFLTQNINDINGFILFISSLFFVLKADISYSKSNKFNFLNFILIFNFLFFQFISQPSPDFLLIVVSQIIFYLFVEENENEDALNIAIFLFLFMFFVKITIAPIGLLILIWCLQSKKGLKLFMFLGFAVTTLLIFKNVIISGFPFYPFDFYSINADWKIPQNLFDFITDSTKNTGYFENQVVANPTYFDKIYGWLHLSGLNRIFNYGMILLFILSIFTVEIRKSKNFKILYFVLLIHFLILLLTSPQFRFFLPEFVFFSAIIIASFCNYLKLEYKLVQRFILLFIIFSTIFIENFNFKSLTSNKLMQENSEFHFSNLLIPENNSKYDNLTFEKIKNGNLEYYSPKVNFFFFGTANGNLPCVNKYQIDYLEKYYFIKPQLRTNNLKDGFYSQILKSNNE